MLPQITVVDCGSRKVPDIVAALARAGAAPRRWPLSVAEALPPADAVVVSGGARLFTREPELALAFTFLDAVTTPVLGICLGHQALGLREGARIYLGPERRGPETIEVLEPHPLFRGLGDRPTFGTDHTEGLSLPRGYRAIARSEAYPVEAIADDARRRYGVQFHPEISGALGERLFANFVALVTSAAAWSEDRA